MPLISEATLARKEICRPFIVSAVLKPGHETRTPFTLPTEVGNILRLMPSIARFWLRVPNGEILIP